MYMKYYVVMQTIGTLVKIIILGKFQCSSFSEINVNGFRNSQTLFEYNDRSGLNVVHQGVIGCIRSTSLVYIPVHSRSALPSN